MLLFSRGLAGLAIGASITVIFSYFGVSYVKYVENLKKLDQYDERSAIRTKGFIFSLFNVGNLLGYTIGGGMLCDTKVHASEKIMKVCSCSGTF